MNRPSLPLVAVLVCCLQLSGCYLIQSANGQMDLMQKRQPITTVIADPTTPSDLRTRLQQVLEIREFAVRELGLPDNGSYRSYADVGRPFVVWNVFAAPEFSVKPERWCFPVAGCVVYRGYFSEAKARAFAERLHAEGNDVYVGGVPAYSTLGHFDDPVLNTMISWSDVRIAAIIFHELTHQLVYVPGDSSFNEGFASVVEVEGVRRWLAAHGREPELASFKVEREHQVEVAGVLNAGRARLKVLYASGVDADTMRERKRVEFERLAREYGELLTSWRGPGASSTRIAQELNNAYLVSVAAYEECVPGLERLLAESGNDLPTFFRKAKALAREDETVRHQSVCAPNGSPPRPIKE
jgi:predicted aminopeptidase